MGLLDLKINRRNFIKYFTGGLLGAGLVPMVGAEPEMSASEMIEAVRQIPEQKEIWITEDGELIKPIDGKRAMTWNDSEPYYREMGVDFEPS